MRNRFLCLRCGEIVESTSRHDFQSCRCGNSADGGADYTRRVGNMADMAEIADDSIPDRLPKGVPQWLLDLFRRHCELRNEALDQAYERGFESGMACAKRTADPTTDPVEQARFMVTDVLRRMATTIESELDRYQGRILP